MIFFSVGLPTRFAAWCDAVIARLAETGYGSVEVVPAESPDGFVVALIRATAPHLLIVARRPTEALRELLFGSGARRFVALDDPRRAVFERVSVDGLNLREAVRDVANSCAAAYVCARLPGITWVHADHDGRDPVAIVAAIAPVFGLRLGAAEIAAVLAGTPDFGDPVPVESWWGSLDTTQRALIDGALLPYREAFDGGGLGEIVWDRTLLWRAPDPASPAGGAIELGDPAWLVGGPDIGLPPGRWTATVSLAVSREAAGVGFQIEMSAAGHPMLAHITVVPDARGLCTASLSFVIGPLSGLMVALNIANTTAAPGGRLAVGNVTLAPGSTHGSDIPAELTTDLEIQ